MSLLEIFDWPKAANELSKVVRWEDLYPEVLNFLSENIEEPWAISCSGGSDSLSLLLLICGHFPQKREGLCVFHYNHKLRGAESDEEALFVESCAKSFGLFFILGEGSAEVKDKSEASLRKKRHEFFSNSLKKIDGNILLLGHQRDDVAETMLMRLARGSGTGGLCAPRPIHRFNDGKVHLRPLITIGKERLLGALEEVGVSWCNDSSNDGEYYLRNRIRRNVIPDWVSASSSDLWKGIVRSRELLEEDDIALEGWLEHIFENDPILRRSPLRIELLSGLPRALYRRSLHKWLQLNEISQHFSAASFSFLLSRLIKSESVRVSVGKKYFVAFNNGSLFLEQNEPVLSFSEIFFGPGSCIPLDEGRFLKAEEVPLTGELKQEILKGKINPAYEVYLNYDGKEEFIFSIRSWAPGDRYKALGAPGTRKLQDMFTDRKISVWEKRRLPVICEHQNGIVWCPGLPVAELFKIEENTQRALKLTFRSNLIKRDNCTL